MTIESYDITDMIEKVKIRNYDQSGNLELVVCFEPTLGADHDVIMTKPSGELETEDFQDLLARCRMEVE